MPPRSRRSRRICACEMAWWSCREDLICSRSGSRFCRARSPFRATRSRRSSVATTAGWPRLPKRSRGSTLLTCGWFATMPCATGRRRAPGRAPRRSPRRRPKEAPRRSGRSTRRSSTSNPRGRRSEFPFLGWERIPRCCWRWHRSALMVAVFGTIRYWRALVGSDDVPDSPAHWDDLGRERRDHVAGVDRTSDTAILTVSPGDAEFGRFRVAAGGAVSGLDAGRSRLHDARIAALSRSGSDARARGYSRLADLAGVGAARAATRSDRPAIPVSTRRWRCFRRQSRWSREPCAPMPSTGRAPSRC